jgi:ubiquinone/menaquinone biosynthesis C-methylase UbiE/broad specificity phosphatase PhoE
MQARQLVDALASNAYSTFTSPAYQSPSIIDWSPPMQTSSIDVANDDYDLRLLLIRHAEEMSVRHGEMAASDAGLTALGWQQTDALAAWLKDRYQISALVSAPELHNRLTAQRIGQAIGLPVIVRRDLSGRIYGANVGADDLTRKVPQVIQELPNEFGPEIDETYRRFCKDLTVTLDRLRSAHPGETMAIVMGEAGISATIACLFDSAAIQVEAAHTSVAELELRHDRWSICCINRREHLPASLKKIRTKEPVVAIERPAHEDLSAVVDIYNRAASSDNCQDEAVIAGKRNRIKSLLAFAKLPSDIVVLDVGAGFGLLSLALAEAGAAEVVGVDISPGMLERAEYLRLSSPQEVAQRVYFRRASAADLPARDERFDAVVCRMVLNHSRDPATILRELVRVLRKKGVLILADLLSHDDPVKRATQNAIEERRNPTHFAARSAQQYRELITEAGLTVVSEKVVVFERELGEWMDELPSDAASDAVVRGMIEAGLETDAAGLNARYKDDLLIFDQRLFYLKAVKK